MHTTHIDVRFSELDPYGHANHAVFLNWFEVGRIDALRSVGMALDAAQADGIHLPVVEASIRFRRPARLGERLTIASVITELRPASAWWEQEIRRDAVLLASARIRTAVTDANGRPLVGPEVWEATLKPLCR